MHTHTTSPFRTWLGTSSVHLRERGVIHCTDRKICMSTPRLMSAPALHSERPMPSFQRSGVLYIRVFVSKVCIPRTGASRMHLKGMPYVSARPGGQGVRHKAQRYHVPKRESALTGATKVSSTKLSIPHKRACLRLFRPHAPTPRKITSTPHAALRRYK